LTTAARRKQGGVMQTVSDLTRGQRLEELTARYRQAAGQWTGCDWRTDFGSAHLDLAELKASQVLLLARATSGKEASDWQAAALWLTRIEQAAQEAETEAGIAFALAATGQFREAHLHAQQACSIEACYHANHAVWPPFCKAIERLLSAPDETAEMT
jgi:hypothetical protein